MANSTFDFNTFLKDSKEVLVNPKGYFSAMPTTGGLGEPVIKALIYGVVGGVIAFIWSMLRLGGATGGLFGGAVGIMLLIWYVIGAVIGLFILAVIMLVISAICKGSTDFEANARVTAAAMVIMPISALLGFVAGLNVTAGVIVGLAVNVFALYLLYHGLVGALKAKPETARVVMIVLVAIFVLFMLLGLGAKRRMSKMMDDFNQQDLKELIKDSQQN